MSLATSTVWTCVVTTESSAQCNIPTVVTSLLIGPLAHIESCSANERDIESRNLGMNVPRVFEIP